MITKKEVTTIKAILSQVKNPVFLFDDDPDGLCSFTLLYRYLECGQGIIVKNSPEVKTDFFLRKIKDYDPDCIIILDKPLVQDSFFSEFSCPIIWIDHHALQDISHKHVTYINPLSHKKESTPTVLQVFEITKDKRPQDLWLAVTGSISDWYFPKKLVKELSLQFPTYVSSKTKDAKTALFTDEVGKIVKTIYFNLKGKMSDVQTAFKVFTRIDSPYEILLSSTPKGKLLFKQYASINKEYEKIKSLVLDCVNDSLFIEGIVHQKKYSFSSELSNEIFFMYPEKIVLVGRSSSGSTKGSIRTSFDIHLPDIISQALCGLDGYGGGHDKAVGFCVADSDFELFLTKVKDLCLEQLSLSKSV